MNRTLRTHLVGAAPACILLACSAPAERATDVTPSESASASTEVAPPANPLTFEALSTLPNEETPVEPKVDGDLSEWFGRTEGADHVGVIVTEKGVYLSGDLDPGYARGVYFTIASKVAELPVIGEPTRGGGHQELDCVHERDYIEGQYIATDRPLKPDVAAKCREYVAAFEKQKAVHAARFARSIAIDDKGIGAIDEKGTRSPIAGATSAWKPGEAGALRFEAFLPASGMPRLSESPLFGLYFVAAPATNGLAPRVIPEMEPLALFAPMTWEPRGAIRTHLFVLYSEPHYVRGDFVGSAGLSYAPGDPTHVESWRHNGGGETVSASNDSLWEPAAKVGDVEVGYTNVHAQYFTIMKGTELVDVVEPPAPIKKILERDGEIHVLAYQESGYSNLTGPITPQWMVAIVDKDGAVRDGVDKDAFAEAREAVKCSWVIGAVSDGKATQSEKWDQLDWTGSCVTSEPGAPKQTEAGMQVTLKWDAKKKTYVGSHKKIAVPKAPAPKP